MRLFIDESGNTGVITPNYHNQLFEAGQPHFVLCALKFANISEEEDLRKKYIDFLNHFGISGELKGSDLMTKNNNELLMHFIDRILDDEHFQFCCYGKKFYLATLISVYLLGFEFRDSEPIIFYNLASALTLEKDDLFMEYCNTSINPTNEAIHAFLNYIINYKFMYIDDRMNLYKSSAQNILKHANPNEYEKPPLSSGYYRKSDLTNMINLNALGELVLMLRYNFGVNTKIEIFHDHVLEFENEFIDSLKDTNTDIHFVDSKDEILVQVADNAASVFRKAFSSSMSLFSCGMKWEQKWFPSILTKLLNKVRMHNLKVVCPIGDQTLLYCIREMFDDNYPISRHNDECLRRTFLHHRLHVLDTISSLDYEFADV